MNSMIRKKKKRRRRALSFLLMFLALSFAGGLYYVNSRLPDRLCVASLKDVEEIELPFSGLVKDEIVAVSASGASNIPENAVKIRCSILGIVPLKTVEVEKQVLPEVIPCGNTVGIFMHTRGILVVGTGIVEGMDGLEYEPALGIVQSGDYIVALNGEKLLTKKELVERICENGTRNVELTVNRNGEEIILSVTPVRTGAETYQLGIWVRDDTQGIGTLTYVDRDKNYGALGHGISDVDTGLLMEIQDGKLYRAQVQAVKKGEKGVPGEISGVIRYQEDQVIGDIKTNRDTGITGTLSSLPENLTDTDYVEAAYRQEVETGPAVIRCEVDGEVKEYEIEIEKVNLSHKDVNKSMTVRVTDEELLEKTGGIVQGMSGSPIIQNGKLVGAVTHVLVNDPTKGYGIFIENMLDAAE